jgi:hypothetical protein
MPADSGLTTLEYGEVLEQLRCCFSAAAGV